MSDRRHPPHDRRQRLQIVATSPAAAGDPHDRRRPHDQKPDKRHDQRPPRRV